MSRTQSSPSVTLPNWLKRSRTCGVARAALLCMTLMCKNWLHYAKRIVLQKSNSQWSTVRGMVLLFAEHTHYTYTLWCDKFHRQPFCYQSIGYSKAAPDYRANATDRTIDFNPLPVPKTGDCFRFGRMAAMKPHERNLLHSPSVPIGRANKLETLFLHPGRPICRRVSRRGEGREI